MTSTGATLDAGALIAIERGDARVAAILDEARHGGVSLAVPAGALGQVWRGSSRQARLGRALALPGVELVDLTAITARAAGALCGRAGTSDVIDASVVLCAAERGHRIVTSDPDDLRRLDPSTQIVAL